MISEPTLFGDPSPLVRTVHVREHDRRLSGPPSEPLARRDDPETSSTAARRLRPSEAARRRAILAAFDRHGPMIDAELYDRVDGRSTTLASARSRYTKDGWLAPTGERRQSPWGSSMGEYGITAAGRMYLYAAMEEAG